MKVAAILTGIQGRKAADNVEHEEKYKNPRPKVFS